MRALAADEERFERDAWPIYASGFLRSATVSLVGVVLAIYLSEIGFSATTIGLLIGAGLAGSSVATPLVSIRGDAWGRKRVLIAIAVLTAAGYTALASFTRAAVLVPLAFFGLFVLGASPLRSGRCRCSFSVRTPNEERSSRTNGEVPRTKGEVARTKSEAPERTPK